MRALDRKLLRDARSHWLQIAATALVMACGVATFVMSVSTLSSLSRALDDFYERGRFADVFAHLKRAPESVAERISAIQGIDRVETRIVGDARLALPGFAEPVAGRLLSLPDEGPQELNVVTLREGRFPEPQRFGEVVLGEPFAEAHGLHPGDRLSATLEGRRRELAVVGVGLSPEFVYPIRPGEMLPDDRRFAVLWLPRGELEAAYDLDGAFNDVVASLGPGAVVGDVLARIDELTARHGGLGAHDRSEQTSHRYLSDEMTQLRAMATVPPVVFLAVAAFLVHVVLGRLVGTQRESIATLKAFGYSDRAVASHYLQFVAIVVVAGAALGVAAGAWLGAGMTELYARFFRFPSFDFHVDGLGASIAVGACALSAAAGGFGAVRRVLRLPPAVALQAEPPARFATSVVERSGLGRLASLTSRMVLRHLEAKPLRSAFACLGIALSAAVVVLGSFVEDSADAMVRRQFEVVERQDVTVSFDRPLGSSAMAELSRLEGVRRCEPIRSVPVRLRSGVRARRLALLGLSPDASLLRVVDAEGAPLPLPEHGLVLTEKLARRLDVVRGDEVTVEFLEGRRPVRALRVAAIVEDWTGLAAWAAIDAVRTTMREQDAVTGAALAVEAGQEDAVQSALRAAPRVAGVTVKAAAVRRLRELLAENLLRMRAVDLSFAVILAVGVVFNAARVSLSEHARELASLRVLGFTRSEVAWVLVGEQALLALAAVPLGLVLGRLFATGVVRGLETETQTFPVVILPSTYGLAAAVTLGAVVVSAYLVVRRLSRMDLVSVLKARE